ncbi:unnamed protein product [Alopecurus aequalis]
MAMSISLARLALPPVLHSTPSVASKRLASATLSFPANSFFGAPLAVANTGAAALSPAAPLPRSLSVVAKAGKLYKMKTHKVPSRPSKIPLLLWAFPDFVPPLVCVCVRVCAAKASAKRFRVTGTGKIVRRCAGKQHLLSKKNAKRRKRLSKRVQVSKSDYSNVMGAMPYLKVNKKADYQKANKKVEVPAE